MNQSATFARHFARLVWLVLREPTNVAEQKVTLRALVTVSRLGEVRLEMRQGTIAANEELVMPVLQGVAELRERMTMLGVRVVEVDAGAAAADVLGAVRQLAGVPSASSGASVRFVSATPAVPAAVVPMPAAPTPDAPTHDALTHHAPSHDALTRHAPAPDAPAPDASAPDAPAPAEPAPVAPAPATPVVATPVVATPVATAAAPAPALPSGEGLFEHFAAARPAAATTAALFAAFDAATGATLLTRLLDGLVRTAEDAAREGDYALVSDVFHRIVTRERQVHDADARRAFMLTVRRLSRSAVLRAVAQGLVRAPEKREQQLSVLTRTGEEGADALIDQLVGAEDRSERRIYFDALLELHAGVPTLLHMLGDPRWFVARNAAVLLGELEATEAEQPLSELLHHDDERVRHAATISLMRLGTPRSMPAIEQALRDSAPQIRMQAAVMLVEHRAEVSPEPIIRALDAEKDDEVKTAFYVALGRFATSEAVEKLTAAAQPERGLFRRKPVALRLAAIRALAEAGTPQALQALVALQADRDADVQRAVVDALERKVRPSKSEKAGW